VTTTDNLIGKTIADDFSVEERIGQGGMAAVYRARQRSFNRDVALKIINIQEEASDEKNFKARFENEAAIIARLEHIHILPVFAYGLHENYAYLVMRLLRGGSVKDLLWQGQPLPLEQAIRLFDQVAKGLAYAHSQGIIHRDLKPANILLDENHNAYLTDFGLAKLIDSDQHLTRTDNVVGTLAYMSPEHLRGDRLDHHADVYSMGVVLYHMLCGRVPFRSEPQEDMVAVIYKHLEEKPPPPRKFNSEIPVELERVILKALAKDVTERYDSMGEFAHEVWLASGVSLGSSSGSYPQVAASLQGRTTSSVRRRRNTRRRMPFIIGTVMLVVAVIVAVLAFVVAQQNAPIPPYTVLIGESVKSETLTPTGNMIARAQRKLGADGFVAIMACNLSSEYHATLNREIVEFARNYGLTFKIYDSNSDGYQQRLELERALTEGAQGIVLCPLDYSLLDATLEEIETRHLPLVSSDSPDRRYGGAVTGVIDYEMGLTAGRLGGRIATVEFAGKPNVIVLDYPDLPTIVQRADGLEAGLKEFAPDANIVGRYLGATKEFAYESVTKLLEEGVTFDMILSINDAGSYGAIQALEEADYAPDSVAIISIDAEEQAKNYIREGRFMRGSLEVARRATAQAFVDMMTRMLAGETVAETIIPPPGDMVTASTPNDE
jgi:serine/threonine protein kinase/DNA-binding LacI/PurR family transcriptional regulator